MNTAMDWQAWHRDYDDADSSVSHRLVQVRARLAALLDEADAAGAAAQPVRWRRTRHGPGARRRADRDVDACLVELDPVSRTPHDVRRPTRGRAPRGPDR